MNRIDPRSGTAFEISAGQTLTVFDPLGGQVADLLAISKADTREMISSGRLSKLLPMKLGDRLTTELVEQEGPIAFVESTTLGEVFAEDENRALPLYTDERPEQTRRILTALANSYAVQALSGRDPGRVRQVHHACQRLLGRREVLIPYAPKLAARLGACAAKVK